MFRAIVKFIFFRDKKEIYMKYVCAMCGKEEEVTGCLSTPTFRTLISSRIRPEDVRRNEGLSPNDYLCPNCYNRLKRKYLGV